MRRGLFRVRVRVRIGGRVRARGRGRGRVVAISQGIEPLSPPDIFAVGGDTKADNSNSKHALLL